MRAWRVTGLAAVACALLAAPAGTSGRGEYEPPTNPPPRLRCTVEIRGTEGDDTIVGSGRSDVITGLDGDDRLEGKSGRDCIGGGAGDDRILAGGAGDHLNGGRGRDRIYGGLGDDRVRAARGGRDHIDCGLGEGDVATIDELEDVVHNCELVKTP